MPFDVWPRREWWDRKEEARRRVDWCRTIVALLEGKSGKFNEAKNVASDRAARYLPVADYRGSVTLTITATPFAEVKSLRRGDVWIVRDGKKTSDLRSGDVQYTPLVLDDVDIADYTAVLVHPQRGEKSLTIPGGAMKHGGRYVFSGSLERPESFTLREVR